MFCLQKNQQLLTNISTAVKKMQIMHRIPIVYNMCHFLSIHHFITHYYDLQRVQEYLFSLNTCVPQLRPDVYTLFVASLFCLSWPGVCLYIYLHICLYIHSFNRFYISRMYTCVYINAHRHTHGVPFWAWEPQLPKNRSHHPFFGSPRLPYNGVNNRRLWLYWWFQWKGSWFAFCV